MNLPHWELRWGPVQVTLYCNDPAVAHYVLEQMHAVSHQPEPTTAVSMTIECGRDLMAATEIRGVRPSFNDWTYVHGISAGTHLLTSADGHEHPHQLTTRDWTNWILYAAPESAGVIACRVLREVVRERVLRQRGQMLHGSGVVDAASGGGVIFLGESGAGKTTLSCLLTAGQYLLAIATDRVMVRPQGDDQWSMVGIPTTTRLGDGALSALVSSAPPPRSALSRYAAGGLVTMDKTAFSNAESEALLDMRFASSGLLSDVVVLAPAGTGDMRLTPLDVDRSTELIAPHVLDPDPNYPTRWLEEDAPASRGAVDAHALAAGNRCWQLAWDPRRHSDQVRTLFLSGGLQLGETR